MHTPATHGNLVASILLVVSFIAAIAMLIVAVWNGATKSARAILLNFSVFALSWQLCFSSLSLPRSSIQPHE